MAFPRLTGNPPKDDEYHVKIHSDHAMADATQ